MRRTLVLGLCVAACAQAASAASLSTGFDSAANGATANSAVAGFGIRFDLAAYLPALDGYGDPIPGSDAYRVDPDPFDDVRVSDPSARGYGAAPSPALALDALDQGVLLSFDSIVGLTAFSVTLDQSGFGFPGTFDVVFQDAAGNALLSLPTQQSVAGFVASLSGPLYGVASIYLPSGAYYDDLELVTVPEPGALLLAALALAGLVRARGQFAHST